jgi:radical SAM protein with 4Fe4S-binding SPASM domain
VTFQLGVEVTRACNFRCSHCFVAAGRVRGEAAREALEDVLHRAARSGVDVVGWSGGEPLLRDDLARLTAVATSLGMRVGLATNGYLATAARLRELREAGLDVVQVSLDGPDAERASRYRRGPRGHFARALDAVRTSVDLGLQTYVCALLAPETLADAEEMAALVHGLGVQGLRYTMWMPVGRASGRRYVEAEWRRPALRRLLAVVERWPEGEPFRVLTDCPTGPLPFRGPRHCGAGRETAYVTAGGDLYPCTALMFPAYRVGNVFERPFDLLFNEGRMFKVLRELARLPVGGACGSCDRALSCRGGCPGRAVAQFGRLCRKRERHPMPICFVRLAEEQSPPAAYAGRALPGGN